MIAQVDGGQACYNRSVMRDETTWIFTTDTLIKEDGSPRDIEARALFQYLKNDYMILSFSSVHSRQTQAIRLQKAGFPVSQERIYTSLMAACDAIRHDWPDRVRMDMIGTKAMEETLRLAGFSRRGNPDWLFVGQNRQAEFGDYSNALEMLLQGAQLVSLDGAMRRYTAGHVTLGNGAIVKMLEAASGKDALHFDRVNLCVLKQAARYGNCHREALAVVDCGNLWDLEELNAAGIRTVLLAQPDTEENLFQTKTHPTWIVKSLSGLYRTLYGA